MLGKLARYLRIIGYDVKYIEKDKDDSYIISISENNLILT
ncbi:MAG: Mut7-C RNAse domain-containing protein, partial [Candidatus Thermoplasmatota archaeon]|nr:Mut7-C RNAse domain-containing protein [Candidatus Thermoplasmatota archaeon]